MASKTGATWRVNVHQAKTELSKLLAAVERGAEVVIARNNEPVAKLVPFPAPEGKRLRVDTWKGRVRVAADFDAALAPNELRKWGY
jgi:prevent-host-death family protein